MPSRPLVENHSSTVQGFRGFGVWRFIKFRVLKGCPKLYGSQTTVDGRNLAFSVIRDKLFRVLSVMYVHPQMQLMQEGCYVLGSLIGIVSVFCVFCTHLSLFKPGKPLLRRVGSLQPLLVFRISSPHLWQSLVLGLLTLNGPI